MPENSIAVLRLESGPLRSKLYMEHIMLETAIQEIVDPLKDIYTQLGAAQSFIDSIKVEISKTLTIDLVIEHPIAKWLEYGTDPHFIDAVEAEFLVFQFRKTSKWFSSKANDTGYWFKGETVYHPGFTGYQMLAILLKTFAQNYARQVVFKTQQYLERSRIQ